LELKASVSVQLVIGASGQVGGHLLDHLQKEGRPAIGTCRQHPRAGLHQLELQDRQAVTDLLDRFEPDIVYLPAALANVDFCELHPNEAYKTNVLGTCSVVSLVNLIGAKLVYFSSDYVFDGLNGPYSETDPARPGCEYGRQKLLSEHYIALHAKNYLIVRTTVVYGWERQGKNFIQRLIDTLRIGQRIRVPIDQVGSPTYAPNLAEAVVELAIGGATGLFHVAGPKLANRYELAVAAAQAFGLDSGLIIPVRTAELEQAAVRPLQAGMRVNKAQEVLHTQLIDYLSGLRLMTSAYTKVESSGS
jgi:dTDP-4-dehydrorhamnose reductase